MPAFFAYICLNLIRKTMTKEEAKDIIEKVVRLIDEHNQAQTKDVSARVQADTVLNKSANDLLSFRDIWLERQPDCVREDKCLVEDIIDGVMSAGNCGSEYLFEEEKEWLLAIKKKFFED